MARLREPTPQKSIIKKREKAIKNSSITNISTKRCCKKNSARKSAAGVGCFQSKINLRQIQPNFHEKKID